MKRRSGGGITLAIAVILAAGFSGACGPGQERTDRGAEVQGEHDTAVPESDREAAMPQAQRQAAEEDSEQAQEAKRFDATEREME